VFVVVIGDNDETGIVEAEQRAQCLRTPVPTSGSSPLPAVPEHGDVSDWFAADADAFRDWAFAAGERRRRDAMVECAKGLRYARIDTFDRHPDLLNLANGVLDLTTNDLHEHDSELLLTKIAPIAFGVTFRWNDQRQAPIARRRFPTIPPIAVRSSSKWPL
jgi:D5 N terminal like